MAFEHLLDWSRHQKAWQQDALRRIAINGELTHDDLAALRLEIEHDAGLESPDGLPIDDLPAAAPLTAEHLSDVGENHPRTVLASLGPVRHVDRLAPDQPPLRFAVNGITLIYGANASGKSGYCRVAKQLCRSLSPVTLRPNVFEGAAARPPEVAVAFRAGNDDQPKDERVWIGGQDPPDELSRISVFDTETARVYVDKERRIEFLPYELDLMNKLVLACRALQAGFRERLTSVDAAISTPLPDGYTDGTAVHAALRRLVPNTAVVDLPSEQNLRTLGVWSPEKGDELAAMEEQLRSEPARMMRVLKDAKRALETARDEVVSIEETVGDRAIENLRQMQQAADAAKRAAEAAARDLFSDEPFSGIGSDVWRKMLSYAREFASTAFPDTPPPQLSKAGLCVLCQQELNDTAKARMAAFDDYIAGRFAQESDAAVRAFAEHRERLARYPIRRRHEIETLLAAYASLTEARREHTVVTGFYVEKARERYHIAQAALREGRYDDLDGLEPLPDAPVALLNSEIVLLKAEIAELETADRHPGVFSRLQMRHAELSDQRRLSEQIEAIVARRNRLEERQRLIACRDQCGSRLINRRLTARRRQILTPTLKRSLTRELQRLGLTHLPLDLADRGEGGDSVVEVALTARQRIANNSEVLSEGEQRALALACFLAELTELGTDHGIIVDDPVSSLDHNRMQAVAERLAEEAAGGRQVIVFTHNIVFHYMLANEARRAQVGCHGEWMRSAGNNQFGVVEKNKKPLHVKDVSERLNDIDTKLQEIRRSSYEPMNENFYTRVVDLYTQMRATWERVVEEILLNKAIERFRPEVKTQSLEAACYNPHTDYPIIFEGMKRCSHYSGHDRASELPPGLPDIERIERDVEELQQFVFTATERKRKLNKCTKYEKVVEAILL